jgi:HAD superfamily phosphoserine phosphatase-like hydrolase
MISAAIFDLDGTLTRTPNPWRHIHESLGVWERACGHFDEWIEGKIDYTEFCRKDFGLWRGRRLEELHEYLDGIEINRHVPTVIEGLKRHGVPSVILSSGFNHVARRIQSAHAWEPLAIYANELLDGPEVRIGVSADLTSPISKRILGMAALQQVGGRPESTLVVSDAVRDLESLDYCAHHLHIEEEDHLLRTLEFLP